MTPVKIGRIRRRRWATRSLSVREHGEWYFEAGGISFSRKTLGEIKAARTRLQSRVRTNRVPLFA